jgi:hypothetical protein
MAPPARDSLWTASAIAAVAFILADAGHEVVGHGIGFLLAGGKSCILTTTRLIADRQFGDPGFRVFDLGGPLGNLLFAGLAWLMLRRLRRPAERFRLLLWLVMAFSLFWGFGYLLYCGVGVRGDWLALVPRGVPAWLWRPLLVAAGFVLYRASMLLSAVELRRIVPVSRVPRLTWIAYLAGGTIACAGAAFDPRGAIEMLNSGAASSFLAAVGLLRMPQLVRRVAGTPVALECGIARSAGWIAAAASASAFYVLVLGPGIRVAS